MIGIEWRRIKDFPYSVSNTGLVRNDRTGKILKGTPHKGGYLWVQLWVNNKYHSRSVHRLVAKSFIDNPDGKPQVNHKDGNTQNNTADNLEWVTCKENNLHRVHVLRIGMEAAQKSRMKKVMCIETGETFQSLKDAAAAYGGSADGLSNHLCGKSKSCMKYHWRYSE